MSAVVDTVVQGVDRRLAELQSLGDDWDSYGGKPPTSSAIEAARTLVMRLHAVAEVDSRDVPPLPEISPLADGGVELEWVGRDALVAIDAGPDGSLGYLIRRGRGADLRYEEGDRISIDEALTHLFATFNV